MLNQKKCVHCSEPSCFLCTCEQLNICTNCKNLHHKHLFFESSELNNIWMNSTNQEITDPETFIKDMIEKLTQQKQQVLSSLSAEKYSLKDSSRPPYEIKLSIDPSLNYAKNQAFIPNPENILHEFNFETNSLKPLNVQIEKSLKSPFWIFKWKDSFVIAGGMTGFSKNKNISMVSASTGKMALIAQMSSALNLFCPVLHEDVLYIVGGRCKKNLREESFSKTITGYPLNDPGRSFDIQMTRERYGVTACMHLGNLHIMSSNVPNSCEIVNLETKETREITISCQITYGSGLFSLGENLYLTTDEQIIIINKDYEVYIKKSLNKFKMILANDEWNQIQQPFLVDGKIYIFGTREFITYDLESDDFFHSKYSFLIS